MSNHKNHLSRAYGLQTQDETNAYYDDWAATYDTELTDAGYVTPERCAAALATFIPDKSLRLLDVGCGTGLSGLAFSEQGFSNIAGSDVSAGMLDVARARGVYSQIIHADPDNPFPFAPGRYAAMAAVGVIGAGAAPLSLLRAMLAKLTQGGLAVFSFNDRTLEDPSFAGLVSDEIAAGRFEVLFREHGPHIPREQLEATVFVLRRL